MGLSHQRLPFRQPGVRAEVTGCRPRFGRTQLSTLLHVTAPEQPTEPAPKPAPPLRQPDAAPAASATSSSVEAPQPTDVAQDAAGKRRVVVAEDETLIRLDLVELLEEEGWSVVGEAPDGNRAVELVEELAPDLVILDVKMPGLDGISVAERIAEKRLAPVVILTAFSQRELVERARDAGAMAYVVKPFTKADLVPAIEMAVSRYQEITQLELEVTDLQGRLETRKLVDRAKGVLQTTYGMSEPEAFRWIQKTSMDRRLTMREVAQAIIAGSSTPVTTDDGSAEPR
jgi:AmiR/NasT family two-component response regulator